ncbi:hypothetical protein CKO15_00415 [Halorhodospira abdelmalekii]|uniref:lipid A deacylase LpxR family protein n=1 Tax=Halorhodospira abdelmalekii TaxID=421629 RepID=UPI001902D751|nr:lipid A deacylase LpxR family protein [Halorhodospira abdelmalekii]MBK1733769.1 hypothetical protein [Halorhodospira abdelmalekii]
MPRTRKRLALLWIGGVVAIGATGAAQADSLAFTFENDIFAGRDQYYTAGYSATWYGRRRDGYGRADYAAAFLPLFPTGGSRRLMGGAGQKLFTPGDITLEEPPEDDRPYAGWLYLTAALVVESGWRQSTASWTLGAVGPSAGGHSLQRSIHNRLENSDQPQGWETQLGDELGVTVRYTDRYRARLHFGRSAWAMDLIPGWSLWAGNVYTAAEAEFSLRFGPNLPMDHGGPIFHPVTAPETYFKPNRGGWYVHARAVRRLVGYNIFLDGNTVRDSRSVERERYVNQVYVGIAFHWERMRISYTHSTLTREFKTQEHRDPYGALQAAWAF